MFAFGKTNFRLSGQKLFLDFKNPYKIIANAEPERSEGEATIAQNPNSENWRKGRDSNPRYHFWHTVFPGLPFQPLTHPSKLHFTLS